MSSSFKSRDAQLAWQIHNQMNTFDVTGITENAEFPNNDLKENYKPKTLIDTTLEVIDPTPNIHTLFVQFNKRFFGNKLLSVEVKWSHRMTSCAGTCSFNTGSRYCVIALSSPLLKLRPRKDLIETLLHEMIHAFLFVTNNNRDRDGHGPEFCKHMARINKEAGTKITIYHSFHAEVKLYQQHWWRCDGPCQKKHPFFGMVRRAMNRAPGPSDFWWKDHQLTCGGKFIKVREPEKKAVVAKGKKTKKDLNNSNIDKWLIPPSDNKAKGKSGSNVLNKPKKKPSSGTNNSNKPGLNKPSKSGATGLKTKGGSSVLTVNKWNTNKDSDEPGVKKLGNTTNNVHGFGTGGPGSSGPSISKPSTSSGTNFSFSGTSGGSSTGRSRLLDLYGAPKRDPVSQPNKNSQGLGPTIQCPICKDLILEKIANEHIDTCLINEAKKKKKTPFINSTPRFIPSEKSREKLTNGNDRIKCPVCDKSFSSLKIQEHIDDCLMLPDEEKSSSASQLFASPTVSVRTSVTSSSFVVLIEDSPQKPILIHDSDSETDTPPMKRKRDHLSTFKEPGIPKSQDKVAACPVCDNEIKIDDMNSHLDACLSLIDDNDRNEAGPSKKKPRIEEDRNVIEISEIDRNDIQSGKEDQTKKPETCLICNEVLDPEIPLTQHLDDCLKNMFNDDSDDSFEKSSKGDKGTHSSDLTAVILDEESTDGESELGELGENGSPSEPNNRFPCPICMSLVPEDEMNGHLNECLG